MYERYAKIRDILGLKDADVCKRAGISPGTMSDWKSGRYSLKLDKLRKIADALGVSVNLFTEEEEDHAFYVDKATVEIAQRVFESHELRMLFDAAADCKPQDIQLAADMLKRMKETNRDE